MTSESFLTYALFSITIELAGPDSGNDSADFDFTLMSIWILKLKYCKRRPEDRLIVGKYDLLLILIVNWL